MYKNVNNTKLSKREISLKKMTAFQLLNSNWVRVYMFITVCFTCKVDYLRTMFHRVGFIILYVLVIKYQA